MGEFRPVLGLDNSPQAIVWKDGTPCGILSMVFDPEIASRIDATRARKEQIRQSENVVLLENYRR
jgi:hypothetical protein